MTSPPSPAPCRRLLSSVSCALLLGLMGAALTGCRSVPFYERERLSDRVMTFGASPLGDEMRGHILSPREASVGGYGAVGAGGCGCH